MNVWTLSLADLRQQKLASALHLSLLSIGVAMIAALLLIATQIGDRFERDSQGVDMVIGAKGSPLQLILSTVYHVDIPTGNIPLDEADKWSKNPMVAQAIPIALGDNARGFRIVGTTQDMLPHDHATLAEGRSWNAPMEAVIGSEVAKAGLTLDASFAGVHGLGASGHAHADHPYRVVGVLAPTHSVADRLIFTSLESVWLLHEAHHHPEAEEAPPGAVVLGADHDDDHDEDHDHDAPTPGQHDIADGSHPSREITALLIRYSSPLAAAGFPRMVNAQSNLLAASPAFETARLLSLLGLGFDTLRGLALVLILAAMLSVFVALYNAMETRQYDLAVLRSLGASRMKVVSLLWLQALTLSVAGTLIGLVLGHLAVAGIGALSGAAKGTGLSGVVWIPEETVLLAIPLLVGTVAAILPAWRAYRTDIATVLARG